MGQLRGQVEGKVRGIAILNHPESFRHPTPWHVRTYGLFNHLVLFLPRKRWYFVLEKGSPLACAIASFSTKAILTRLIFRRGSTTFQALGFALV